MVYNLIMENKVQIGEIIKNKRLLLNLRMDDVAKQVGITRPTLWSIENGNGNYSIDVLLNLLSKLNLSLDIGVIKETNNRSRATRANSIIDKKINRFIVMCVEQYASSINSNSKSAYVLLNKKGVIKELADDYEDMHGMSTLQINEYISARMQGE